MKCVSQRCVYFDVLKAMAIIAVVLYHMGISTYGYLGVDVFLVIAGYFTSHSISKRSVKIEQWSDMWWEYYCFLKQRLFRLWPLIILAGFICLLFGWFMMLPDDYENTAQSVVATNFFGNNILAAITLKNYWDVWNEFKPLMHTWYVGVLMQYYVFVPFLLFCIAKCSHDICKTKYVLWLIFFCSFILYLFVGTDADKFYFLPFRLFEFCVGGLVYYGFDIKKHKYVIEKGVLLLGIVYLAILLLIFLNMAFLSNPVRLLLVVLATAILLYLLPRVAISTNKFFSNSCLAVIGASSYSIFVWHQIIFAFTRYSFTSDLTSPIVFVSIFSVISLLSYLSYNYIEKMKPSNYKWIFMFIGLLLSTVFSLFLYVRAGVVRDIPELDVSKDDVHRGMWAEYCDEGYKYDKDFTDSNKRKVLVIGNSFGRDIINVIRESKFADSLEVSYCSDISTNHYPQRFKKADVVLLSTLGQNVEQIMQVRQLCNPTSKFYVVGEKNFGVNNGQVFCHRFEKNYCKMTVFMQKGYNEKNDSLKKLFPKNFIDLIGMIKQPDGKVRVFSDDGRFLSQDCRHLTKAGAQFFAKKIDWNKILK